MMRLEQTGAGMDKLRITTDEGRVCLDGDEVNLLITYLKDDPEYATWLEEAAQ